MREKRTKMISRLGKKEQPKYWNISFLSLSLSLNTFSQNTPTLSPSEVKTLAPQLNGCVKVCKINILYFCVFGFPSVSGYFFSCVKKF